MTKRSETTGYLFAIANMVTYGLLPVVAHYFVSSINPLLFGGITALVGSLPLLGYIHKKQFSGELFSHRNTKLLLIIGLLEIFGTFTFYVGTKYTSGINTGLLLQLEPFYGIILAVLFLGEVVSINHILATFIMVIGAIVVVFKGFANINIGDILIFVTPIWYQISNTISKPLLKKVSDPMILPTAKLLITGIFLTIIIPLLDPSSLRGLFTLHNIFWLLLYGIIFRTLDQVTWFLAIKHIPLSKASSIIPLSVAISFFGSIIFLHETPVFRQYLGLILIAGGLIWFSVLHLRSNRKKSKNIVNP